MKMPVSLPLVASLAGYPASRFSFLSVVRIVFVPFYDCHLPLAAIPLHSMLD